MANKFDTFGDIIRRLRGMGVSQEAAEAAARAATRAPAQPLPLDVPPVMGAESASDYLGRLGAAHNVDSVHGPTARTASGFSPDIDPLVSPAAGQPDFELGSPLWGQMNKSAGAYDNLRKGRTANLRNQNPDLVRIAQANINEANAAAAPRPPGPLLSPEATNAAMIAGMGAGAVAAGYGASQLLNTPATSEAPKPAAPPAKTADVTDTSGTADLAAESRPAPKVDATDKDGVPTDEAEFTQMFKEQYTARDNRMKAKGQGGYGNEPNYSDQAKAILDDLNQRRRKAGREVPEAKQMMDEANRLLALSNKQRNAPGYKPQNTMDPRQQAQMLLQKLNAERMEAGGEVPHAGRVMDEVRRLQALGDRQRWGG